jgi:hypothetical protein
MSGSAYEALKEGSIFVGQSIFENKEFEYFMTVFYDNRAKGFHCDTIE